MALRAMYEIRCSCGASFTGNLYEYVFSEYDPELKDSILSGEFNSVTCPSCEQRMHVENRFLYRDEKNNLWVWVCKKGEERRRDELARELIEQNAFIEGHFLDGKESYRKFLVFGREGLIELLLKEDRSLKRSEGRRLKNNPALRLILEEGDEPGYLLLSGKKIRIAIPLKLSEALDNLPGGDGEKKRWLIHYSRGLNIHNPYSSFLSKGLRSRWNRIREKEPFHRLENEYDDFAASWAGYRMNAKSFNSRYPERRAFIRDVKNMDVPRRLRSIDSRVVPRESS